MAKHIKFMAYCALVVGLLFLIASLLPLIPQTPLPGFFAPAGFEQFNPRVAAVTVVFFALPPLLVFAGLRRLRPWGRDTTLAFATLTFALPVSWYAFWVLTRPESKDLFGFVPRAKAKGFERFVIVATYIVVAPVIVIANLGFVCGIVKSLTNPPTAVRPIRDIITGKGSETWYCGVDAVGKQMSGRRVVSIKGVVASPSNSSYLLVDGAGVTERVVVLTNTQFPAPAAGEKIQVLGFVQCSFAVIDS